MSNAESFYLVTDVGVCSPCTGIVIGAFQSEAEAQDCQARVEEIGPQKFGFWQDNDVGVLPVKMFQTTQDAIDYQVSRHGIKLDD